ISTILVLQAWADDISDYDDPNNNENGHYAAAIGYFSGPAKIANLGKQLRARSSKRLQLSAERAKAPREDYLLSMDTSTLCRYAFMSWTNLDKRWHDIEGPRRKRRVLWHTGIVVDPNGRKPVFDTIADEML